MVLQDLKTWTNLIVMSLYMDLIVILCLEIFENNL